MANSKSTTTKKASKPKSKKQSTKKTKKEDERLELNLGGLDLNTKNTLALFWTITVLVALCLGASLTYLAFTRGISVTPLCEYYGAVYKPGDDFNAADGCNTCTCTDDGIECTEMDCTVNEPDADANDVLFPGNDEPAQFCIYDEIYYSEGEEFLSEDGASICTCEEGNVSCTVVVRQDN